MFNCPWGKEVLNWTIPNNVPLFTLTWLPCFLELKRCDVYLNKVVLSSSVPMLLATGLLLPLASHFGSHTIATFFTHSLYVLALFV